MSISSQRNSYNLGTPLGHLDQAIRRQTLDGPSEGPGLAADACSQVQAALGVHCWVRMRVWRKIPKIYTVTYTISQS
jgi:hypothetical protein